MWLQLGNLLKGKHSMRSVIPDADGAIRTMGKTIAVTTIPTIINASNMSAHQGSSFNFFLQPMIHNEVFFSKPFFTAIKRFFCDRKYCTSGNGEVFGRRFDGRGGCEC